MGEVTLSELLNFNPDLWTSQAEGWERTSRIFNLQATQLDMTAQSVEQSQTGPSGVAAAAALRARAQMLRAIALEYATVAAVLRSGAAAMKSLQSALEQTVDTLEGAHITVAWDGSCSAKFTLDLPEWIRRRQLAKAGERICKELLRQANDLDSRIADALQQRKDLPPPKHSDTGPVDLSVAGIEAAAQAHAQGAWGNCTQLSSLRALAATDPEELAKHVQWDAAKGVYMVQLYDPETGAPLEPIAVDPNLVVDTNEDTRDPDKITIFNIYEQALITADPTHSGQALERGFRTITGEDPMMVDNGSFKSTAVIDAALESDPPHAVTTATPVESEVDYSKLSEDQYVVPNHAYHVVERDDDGNYVLANPWGHDSKYELEDGTVIPIPAEVTLTPEQYRELFPQTAIAGG